MNLSKIKIQVDVELKDGRVMRGIQEVELAAFLFEDNIENSQRLASNVINDTFMKLHTELHKK